MALHGIAPGAAVAHCSPPLPHAHPTYNATEALAMGEAVLPHHQLGSAAGKV